MFWFPSINIEHEDSCHLEVTSLVDSLNLLGRQSFWYRVSTCVHLPWFLPYRLSLWSMDSLEMYLFTHNNGETVLLRSNKTQYSVF